MRILIFLLLGCAVFTIQAQETTADKRITENGKTFILYKVQPGETLYSIGKRYNVEIGELNIINPQLSNGLKSGEVIKIPAAGTQGIAEKNGSAGKPDLYLTHKVQRKETLYSIAKKYNISIEEILNSNPGLTHPKKGENLRIPQWKDRKENIGPWAGKKLSEGEKTFIHTVSPGETPYSISRKYGIPVDALLERNPDAGKIKPGMRLVIPLQGDNKTDETGESRKFLLHKVVHGETLYSISRKYKVTTDLLVEFNPSLEKSCKAGSTLRIPIEKKPEEERKEEVKKNENQTDESGVQREKGLPSVKIVDCEPLPASMREKQTLNVVLLLPVMLAENKMLNRDLWNRSDEDSGAVTGVPSDTLRTVSNSINQMHFHGNSENFIHFYEGALLAVDSLRQAGIRVDLGVWDTEQKPSKVKSYVSSGVLNDADLIIGPVYPNELKEISDFASRRRIPVISPLSPSDEQTRENEYFFQVNPTREYTAEKTREYIISSYLNSNIVVLQTSNSGNEAEHEVSGLRKELENKDRGNTTISICNFRKEGFASLKGMMVKDRKNVLVLPTVNEAEASVVVSNMKNLSEEYDLVVIGNSRFPQFESIDPEHYHISNLEFLTPYWPDMNQQVTRSFVNNFRLYFRTDPNQYSIQGYDVTFFFVKALSDFGSGFRKCISGEKVELVQGTYRFSRISSGGYINSGLSVIQYLPSYEIVRKTVIADR